MTLSFRKLWSLFLIIIIFTIFIVSTEKNNSIPQKNVIETFKTTPVRMLIPSGQLIGVKLNVEGIFVVGFSDIENSKLTRQSPALMNGIQMGDCIFDVNGRKLISSKQLAFYVKNSKGSKLVFKIKRKSKIITTSVRPLMSGIDKSYKIGLWVRDSTAGVGTMTFYDPETMQYGALGHAINDIDTGLLLPIKDGHIYNANILSIESGERGKPGELKGTFSENNVMGILTSNTMEGIYGRIDKSKGKLYNYKNAIPVASQEEIVVGPAKIMASLDGETKLYDIKIEKLTKQNKPDSKGIVLKIIDRELLKKTGGIVQGMSGSPIIQNGKLVGAVTHVIVNRPDMGYGIYIEWMIKQLNTVK